MLATKLNMSTDNAERWIVNLIREARLDAKIDAKEVNNHLEFFCEQNDAIFYNPLILRVTKFVKLKVKNIILKISSM